jgi:predicted nucleic acid-binding protein
MEKKQRKVRTSSSTKKKVTRRSDKVLYDHYKKNFNKFRQMDFSDRIKERFPGFEKEWKKLVRMVGEDFVGFLREKVSNEFEFLRQLGKFKFKLVVDNNFVLGQIKGAIKKKEVIENSFLFKLLMSKSVEIFAPPLLKKELHDKIIETIDKNDHELAVKYATVIMSRMTVTDAQWKDSWKKANNLIGEHDPDDVPYLALAFEMGSQAILSFDDIFHRQGDVQVWKHGDADKIITNYNSGFISIALIGNIGNLLIKLAATVFGIIRDVIIDAINLLVKLGRGLVIGISKLPPIVIFGLIALGVLFFDEIKTAGADLLKFLKEKAQEILTRIKVAISEILDIIARLLDIAKLGATITFEFLAFLLTEYNNLNQELQLINFDNVSGQPTEKIA